MHSIESRRETHIQAVGYRFNRLAGPVFIAGPKPLLTEFGIHQRLESCYCFLWDSDKNLIFILLLFDAWLGHLHILRHIYRMTQEVIKSICHWNTCLFHCPKQMLKTAVLNVIYPERDNTQDINWAICYAMHGGKQECFHHSLSESIFTHHHRSYLS